MNFKYSLLAAAVACSMTSCLEDKGYLDIYNAENDGAVVSFFGGQHGLYSTSIDFKPEAQNLPILQINAARAVGDITVTLKVDPAALDAYNTEQEALAVKNDTDYTPYELLPDSTYSIPSLTITLPKGKLDTDVIVTFEAPKISFDYNYVLPLTIESISGDAVLASNLKTSLLNVSVKNLFDGKYKVIGAIAGHPSLSGDVAMDELEYYTAAQYTNWFYVPYGKAGSQFAVTPAVTVDVNTNMCSLATQTAGTGVSSPTILNADPSNDVYYPALKTFKLTFGWTTRTSTDSLIYVKPR